MGKYAVDPGYLKIYSLKEIEGFIAAFQKFDLNQTGSIDRQEVKQVLTTLGENLTTTKAKTIIHELDVNSNRTIEFQEFFKLLHYLRPASREPTSNPTDVVPANTTTTIFPPSSSVSSISKTFGATASASTAKNYVKQTSSSGSGIPARKTSDASTTSTSTPTSFVRQLSSSNHDIPTRKTSSASFSATAPPVPHLASAIQKQLHLHEVHGSGGAVHSYSEDERVAFTEHVNNCLNGDPQLPRLPIDPLSEGLFDAVADGILLCKLINQAVADTIDMRVVNVKDKLNVYQKTENQNLSINAAKSIGCTIVNIGPQDLIEGNKILIMGLIWQIVKIQLTATINLKHHPELVRLLKEDESLEEFMKLPPDQILLRWMNYHLSAANYSHRVCNFGNDVKDAKAYSALLHQIAPSICDLCHESVAEQRAAHVIENSRRLNVEAFLKATDITSGNPRLNMSFVAQLFNTCPALHVEEEKILEVVNQLDDEDVGDSREERVFRMWINSLGIDGVYVNHLYGDLRDGVIILKVMDKINPGVVSWKSVNLEPKNKFKKVENCNYCVVLGKQMKFSLVNIGGVDIVEGSKKLILALMWQLMRFQQLKILSSLAHGGHEITDQDIIAWANRKVQSHGRSGRTMTQFRDSTLSDSLYLIDLVHGVEPRAVNWELVTRGATEVDKISNAKLVLSVARKIGAAVLLTYEDILEVNPKIIMTFVATLMSVDVNKK